MAANEAENETQNQPKTRRGRQPGNKIKFQIDETGSEAERVEPRTKRTRGCRKTVEEQAQISNGFNLI